MKVFKKRVVRTKFDIHIFIDIGLNYKYYINLYN